MLEKFKESVNKGNGASLTDISKAFDCIYRKFLIAKLFWYGGSTLSFNPIFIQFSNLLEYPYFFHNDGRT